MSDQQQFCLRWNDFQSNIVTCFKHLRTERSFTDVTLACDGQTTKGCLLFRKYFVCLLITFLLSSSAQNGPLRLLPIFQGHFGGTN